MPWVIWHSAALVCKVHFKAADAFEKTRSSAHSPEQNKIHTHTHLFAAVEAVALALTHSWARILGEVSKRSIL